MRQIAIVLNTVSFVFTALVLATDGVTTEAFYLLFSLLLLAVPLLSAIVIYRLHAQSGRKDEGLAWAAVVCNTILLGLTCWVVATQYASHPKEAGLLPYTAVVLLVPVLSLFVLRGLLARSRAGGALAS